MDNSAQHTVTVTDRESVVLTAIKDVDAFNEQEILAVCDLGEISIKGELLHIEELSLESGFMSVSGKITAIMYSEKLSQSSVFKKLFGA